MKQDITAVVAIAENNAIAKDGSLPWDKIPEDSQQYKDRTQECPIIVGRTTYEDLTRYEESFIKQSPTAVVTTNESFETRFSNHTTVHTKDEVLDWANKQSEEVYNLGGGQIYQLLFPYCNRLIVSHIPVEPANADVFFPTIESKDWAVDSKECFDSFTLIEYSRED